MRLKKGFKPIVLEFTITNRLLPSSNIKCGGAVKQKNKRHIKNTIRKQFL